LAGQTETTGGPDCGPPPTGRMLDTPVLIMAVAKPSYWQSIL